MRLVRLAPCGCVVAIAAATITTPVVAASLLGGHVEEWHEMSLDDAAELFLRSCPVATS